jgi:glutathione reductase (NADPH)
VEEGTDRLLGAHLLGDQGGETINLFAVAIRSGMPATDLRHVVFSYPTHASDVTYMET